MKICQILIILIATDMCNSTGRTLWSSFENIAWTCLKFPTRTVQFPALKITVFECFWGLHWYFIHIGQGIAKHPKKQFPVFSVGFRACLELFKSLLRHTRMSWMVSRLLTKSQQKLPSQQSRMLWRILGQLLHYLDIFGSKKWFKWLENTMIFRT